MSVIENIYTIGVLGSLTRKKTMFNIQH